VIVGYAAYGKREHGFERTSDGRLRTFDVAGSNHTFASAINRARVITGYFEDGKHNHGFVGSLKSGFTSFDTPNATETYALSINDSGVIAGYYWGKDNNVHGFIRTP
jgi:hypothetical protein